MEAFKTPTNLREKGLRFGGSRYTCVRADKNSIYAKDVSWTSTERSDRTEIETDTDTKSG